MMKILELANWISLAAVLIVAMYQDIKKRKIKNVVNVTGVVLGILFAALLPERELLPAFVGFFVLLVVGIACWRLKLFRAGDAKLLCAVGAFLEWKMGLNILLLSILCGAVLGLPLVIRRMIKKEKELTKFPFSLAIALASVLGIFFGYVWEWIEFM